MRVSVTEYCKAIGTDRMLVQGAGGNVSWKDNNTLWIKASGTWLADAGNRDIFVPVDLPHLQAAITSGDFEISPKLSAKSSLRPSIETLLHALMPHTVVVHVHAIEALVHLVKFDSEYLIDESIKWVDVDYHKPGEALARAVYIALDRVEDVNVVFLKNHGVVIGGSDVTEIDKILRSITQSMTSAVCEPVQVTIPNYSLDVGDGLQYFPVEDIDVHQLAINPILFDRLETDWALYPDHVVFLGAKAEMYANADEFRATHNSTTPELVFIKGFGVFTKQEFTIAKQAQLRCYYDVLSRLPAACKVNALEEGQVAELLNWDAERYRMNVAK